MKNLGLALVNPVQFNTDVADKNGKLPVMLRPVAGKLPNKFIIAGTIAENEGFSIGKTYLVQIMEREEDQIFGRQFTYQKLSEVTSPLEIILLQEKLGEGSIFDTLKTTEVKNSVSSGIEA